MKDDRLYLIDMLEIALRIQRRISQLSREQFDADEDIQLAITHRLQMIGEAASRVSESTRAAMYQVPWKQIAEMRHRIVHDYLNVNQDVVWESATRSVPDLIQLLLPIVNPIIAQAKKPEQQP